MNGSVAKRSVGSACTCRGLKRSAGFTLIELLVAMFLLAILGTAGFQMLFQITATRDRIDQQSVRLSELQRTFYWLAEDVTQIADREVRSAVDSKLSPLQFNLEGVNSNRFSPSKLNCKGESFESTAERTSLSAICVTSSANQ